MDSRHCHSIKAGKWTQFTENPEKSDFYIEMFKINRIGFKSLFNHRTTKLNKNSFKFIKVFRMMVKARYFQ